MENLDSPNNFCLGLYPLLFFPHSSAFLFQLLLVSLCTIKPSSDFLRGPVRNCRLLCFHKMTYKFTVWDDEQNRRLYLIGARGGRRSTSSEAKHEIPQFGGFSGLTSRCYILLFLCFGLMGESSVVFAFTKCIVMSWFGSGAGIVFIPQTFVTTAFGESVHRLFLQFIDALNLFG